MPGTSVDWVKDLGMPVLGGLIIAALIALGVVFRKGLARLLGFKSKEPNFDDKLMDRNETLAEKYGATNARLGQILAILNAHDIPPNQLDAKLEEFLSREQEMLERLESAPAVNAETDQLRKEAEEAIRNGDTDQALNLLHQAETRDTQAAVSLDDEADDRRHAAAESAFAQGELTWNDLDYAAALDHFQRSINLLPKSDIIGRGETLNWVGRVLEKLARYSDAEAAFKESRTLLEGVYGNNSPELAPVLNNLAQLYQDTNRLERAEPLMERALKFDETALGPDHPNVAIDLNNLAILYRETNRLAEAEPLMKRALKIDEAAFGPDHPKVAIRLNNLGQFYQDSNRFSEAEQLIERALKIGETTFGTDHPTVATRLNNLAVLYKATNRKAKAEEFMERALKIHEAAFGPTHPNVATHLNNLAALYEDTNRSTEAESLYERALGIFKSSLGSDHPNTIMVKKNLKALPNKKTEGD